MAQDLGDDVGGGLHASLRTDVLQFSVLALLQVTSYPMHDPVMMDRGFLADRDTTRRSFLHAFWISSLLILAFGLLGVFAGLQRSGEEQLLETLARVLGAPAMLLLGTALVISAASTMALFALGGLLLVFVGTDDLFAAVAVSGTARCS